MGVTYTTAAANTYVPISTYTVPSATTSVALTSIVGTYTDLRVVINAKVSTVANANIRMQVNGDTGNSYSTTLLAGTGTVAESVRYSNYSASTFVNIDAPINNTTFNPTLIDVMNYSNATTYKTWLTRASNAAAGTDAMVGLWRSTAAITSLTFTLSSSLSFDTGSVFSLYGILGA